MIRKFLKYTLLMFIAGIQIYPFFWMLSFSLKTNREIFGGNVMGIPSVFYWENYVKAVGTGQVLNYFINSIIVSVGAITLTLLLSLMLAYAIARLHWRFGRALLVYVLLGIMIPVHAIVLPVFIVIHKIGLYNTYASLILVNAATTMPFAVPILAAYMRGLPKELEESAALDGANVYAIFTRIITPIIMPSIIVVLILAFIAIWNEFMMAYILIGKSSLFTITVGLFALKGRYDTDWGLMGAGMVIASFPTIIVYLVLNKKIQESFITGSVKG